VTGKLAALRQAPVAVAERQPEVPLVAVVARREQEHSLVVERCPGEAVAVLVDLHPPTGGFTVILSSV
jgi:hypothetical protein